MRLELRFSRSDKGSNPYVFPIGRQEYQLHGESGSVDAVIFDWSDEFHADLAAVSRLDCSPEVLVRMGDWLADSLGEAWAKRVTILAEAWRREESIYLTIRSAAAEIYALPWELLTVVDQRLGTIERVLIRYAWPQTHAVPETPAPRPEGGRILFAWSGAGGRVPTTEHAAALERASRAAPCDETCRPFDPLRDVLAHVSLDSLDGWCFLLPPCSRNDRMRT